MSETLLVFNAALPVYLIVGIGLLLRKTGTLDAKMDKGLMTMVVQVLFPCLVLDKMLGVEILRDAGTVFSAAGTGFGLIALGCGIAWLVAKAVGMDRGSGERTFAVAGGLQNYGYVAIPLLIAVFPSDNATAVILTHNLGVELAMWTIGLILISGVRQINRHLFLKGPIIAVVLGITLQLTHTDHFVPDVMRQVFSILGPCAIPTALLLIGTTIYDLVDGLKLDFKTCSVGAVTRLALVPFVILAFAKYVPIGTELKQVLVIQAAMPSAMFPILLSRHYGGRTDIAVQVVIATTVVGLATMPFVISFGKWWVGV